MSRGEMERICRYSNFRHRLIVVLFWGPRVACYGKAAIVKTARHVFTWTLTRGFAVVSASARAEY